MAYKYIEFYYGDENAPALKKVMGHSEILESTHIRLDNNLVRYSLLVSDNQVQSVADDIQQLLGKSPLYHARVITVDAVIPKPKNLKDSGPEEPSDNGKKNFLGVSREELLEVVSKGAVLDTHFFLLVIASTLVAAIGLLENNVAVVIGAMVIAPLLGPNLALAFATALGDIALTRNAIKTNLAGFTLCLLISIMIGMLWPSALDSKELLLRTHVSYDGVVLAIVSGAAAVLSLTRGVSSTMVGVMVAVALLPPATTFGILLGAGQLQTASGALLLLAVNIVCVNFAAKLTLLWKGVRPRTWYEQAIAKNRGRWHLLFWMLALVILLVIMHIRDTYGISGEV